MEAFSKTVLVVDDDAFIRRPLEFLLTEELYQVVLAESIAECRSSLAEQPIDLLILDLRLPDGDGLALCQELKADPKTKELPIVLLTGKGQESLRQQGLQAGALDYVTKPFSPSDIRDKLENWLA